MSKYILKRLFHSIITIIVVTFSVFVLLRQMPSTGYFTRNDYERLSKSQRESYLHEIGVKGNVVLNYAKYMGKALTGDMGESITVYPKTPVTKIISEKAKYSLGFGLVGIFISIVTGIVFGTVMAQYKEKIPDHIGTFYVVFVRSVPNLIYLFLIQIYVTKWLGIPTQFSSEIPSTWLLPVISIALVSSANYSIWTRRFMVDEMNKDYVKFNISKGFSRTRNFYGHIFRNAIIPFAQLIPEQILLTIAGFLIVENLYGIPGMGKLLITSVARQDNTLVQSLVLIFSVLGVIGIFLGDLLMVALDPRIKLEKEA